MRPLAAVVVLAAVLPLTGLSTASAQPSAAAAEVVVVGVPGLRWDDVDARSTPALHALAQRSAVGVLSVKAVPALSCPADGWLTLAAGNRAAAFGTDCGGLDVDLQEQRSRNLGTRQEADVRALAEALGGAGGCLATRGPGAALTGGRTGDDCEVLVVDAGSVTGDGPARAADAAVADAVIAELDELTTLLVVGLAGVPGDDGPRLHVAMAYGAGFEAGTLRSASTRRAPYLQLIDVAPTVLDLVGVAPPASMTGQPWRSTGEAPSVAELVDLDLRAEQARAVQVPFFVVLLAALLITLGAARVMRSWRTVELAGLSVVAAVAGSYLAGLVPWWRAPAPPLAFLVVVAVVAVVGVLAADRIRGPVRPAGVLCGALAGLLALDLITGAGLQIDTPAGYSPLVAGRFAGIGNVAFGVLAAAVLLALAAATHRRSPRSALAMVAVGGLVAVVVDGAPPFGSDVGGVLALVPALVLLGLLRTGTRVSVLRLLAAGAAGVVVVAAFALADWSRDPADRTHLGRFVEQVADGTAGVVLRRKAEAVLDLLLANAATALLPLVAAAAVLLVVRPPAPLRRAFETVPAWRHGVYAVGAVSAIGFVVNDSGPAVPALALLVAVPATLAVVARREQHEPPDR